MAERGFEGRGNGERGEVGSGESNASHFNCK